RGTAGETEEVHDLVEEVSPADEQRPRGRAAEVGGLAPGVAAPREEVVGGGGGEDVDGGAEAHGDREHDVDDLARVEGGRGEEDAEDACGSPDEGGVGVGEEDARQAEPEAVAEEVEDEVEG